MEWLIVVSPGWIIWRMLIFTAQFFPLLSCIPLTGLLAAKVLSSTLSSPRMLSLYICNRCSSHRINFAFLLIGFRLYPIALIILISIVLVTPLPHLGLHHRGSVKSAFFSLSFLSHSLLHLYVQQQHHDTIHTVYAFDAA